MSVVNTIQMYTTQISRAERAKKDNEVRCLLFTNVIWTQLRTKKVLLPPGNRLMSHNESLLTGVSDTAESPNWSVLFTPASLDSPLAVSRFPLYYCRQQVETRRGQRQCRFFVFPGISAFLRSDSPMSLLSRSTKVKKQEILK